MTYNYSLIYDSAGDYVGKNRGTNLSMQFKNLDKLVKKSGCRNFV